MSVPLIVMTIIQYLYDVLFPIQHLAVGWQPAHSHLVQALLQLVSVSISVLTTIGLTSAEVGSCFFMSFHSLKDKIDNVM